MTITLWLNRKTLIYNKYDEARIYVGASPLVSVPTELRIPASTLSIFCYVYLCMKPFRLYLIPANSFREYSLSISRSFPEED